MLARLLSLAIALCWMAAASRSEDAIPTSIARALADSHRPQEQVKLDLARKPASVVAFATVKSGDIVVDFMPGNAYFTRILSPLVGPQGRVYAFTPQEQVDHCEPAEIAGSRLIEQDSAYKNVVPIRAKIDRFSIPEKVDVIWTSQNYHDLHDRFLGPADVASVNRRFFAALKPGGVIIVIDHAAAPGTGLGATETLHRIEPRRAREELEAAGFVFDGELNELHNAADDHTLSVFNPSIRGRTDQFVYRFRKPG